jgi:hypothetical protein
MRKIDAEMQKFREVSCHLWNSYLMPGRYVLRLDIENSFEIIERELLRCFALYDIENAVEKYRKQPIDCLSVRIAKNFTKVAMQVGERDENENVVWKEAGIFNEHNFPELRFFDFFDWDHYGPIGYEFVRAVEVKTGRVFLLPQESCSFWLSDCKAV